MAVPFMLEPDPDDTPIVHYLRIQNLLRELMTLLRQMPSRMIGKCLYYNIYRIGPFTPDVVVSFMCSFLQMFQSIN